MKRTLGGNVSSCRHQTAKVWSERSVLWALLHMTDINSENDSLSVIVNHGGWFNLLGEQCSGCNAFKRQEAVLTYCLGKAQQHVVNPAPNRNVINTQLQVVMRGRLVKLVPGCQIICVVCYDSLTISRRVVESDSLKSWCDYRALWNA